MRAAFQEGFRAWPYVWRRSLFIAAIVGVIVSALRAAGAIRWLDELTLGVVAFVATQGVIALLFLIAIFARALRSG